MNSEIFRQYTDPETYQRIVTYPNLTEMWESSVSAYPQNVAVVDGGVSYTYAELNALVARFRAVLVREGAVGGLLSATLCMLIYAAILHLGFRFRVNYALAALYGFTGAMVGVIGDLCFSAIKRQTGIKDYGNLIPGHGGLLDRFDSMMMVAPLMEALLLLMPVVI